MESLETCAWYIVHCEKYTFLPHSMTPDILCPVQRFTLSLFLPEEKEQFFGWVDVLWQVEDNATSRLPACLAQWWPSGMKEVLWMLSSWRGSVQGDTERASVCQPINDPRADAAEKQWRHMSISWVTPRKERKGDLGQRGYEVTPSYSRPWVRAFTNVESNWMPIIQKTPAEV